MAAAIPSRAAGCRRDQNAPLGERTVAAARVLSPGRPAGGSASRVSSCSPVPRSPLASSASRGGSCRPRSVRPRHRRGRLPRPGLSGARLYRPRACATLLPSPGPATGRPTVWRRPSPWSGWPTSAWTRQVGMGLKYGDRFTHIPTSATVRTPGSRAPQSGDREADPCGLGGNRLGYVRRGVAAGSRAALPGLGRSRRAGFRPGRNPGQGSEAVQAAQARPSAWWWLLPPVMYVLHRRWYKSALAGHAAAAHPGPDERDEMPPASRASPPTGSPWRRAPPCSPRGRPGDDPALPLARLAFGLAVHRLATPPSSGPDHYGLS